MAQKYDLTDIGNALSRVMDNPMTKIIRSGSIGVLGVVNPVAGIVGGIGNDLLSEYNTFKLGHLLNGLASGFNLERRLNELYIVVKLVQSRKKIERALQLCKLQPGKGYYRSQSVQTNRKCRMPKGLRYLWSNSCKPFRNTYRIHARRIDCL